MGLLFILPPYEKDHDSSIKQHFYTFLCCPFPTPLSFPMSWLALNLFGGDGGPKELFFSKKTIFDLFRRSFLAGPWGICSFTVFDLYATEFKCLECEISWYAPFPKNNKGKRDRGASGPDECSSWASLSYLPVSSSLEPGISGPLYYGPPIIDEIPPSFENFLLNGGTDGSKSFSTEAKMNRNVFSFISLGVV